LHTKEARPRVSSTEHTQTPMAAWWQELLFDAVLSAFFMIVIMTGYVVWVTMLSYFGGRGDEPTFEELVAEYEAGSDSDDESVEKKNPDPTKEE
jgi:hypothetical protein